MLYRRSAHSRGASPKSNLRKTLQCRGREPLVLLWVRNAHRAPLVSTAECYIGAQPTRAVHLLDQTCEKRCNVAGESLWFFCGCEMPTALHWCPPLNVI